MAYMQDGRSRGGVESGVKAAAAAAAGQPTQFICIAAAAAVGTASVANFMAFTNTITLAVELPFVVVGFFGISVAVTFAIAALPEMSAHS